ncbi:MAG: bifunctional diguanylate cyclase/phosphodiesterase [Pseudomonadota bacterium]
MSGRDDGMAAAGVLALADSLTTLRQLIDASHSPSVADLVSATVNALLGHQDYDGCVVVMGSDGDSQQASTFGQRSAARMPAFLDPIVSSEIVPLLMDEGVACFEPRLGDRIETGYGSLLGVPVREGARVLGGLIVWNQEESVLMPWHQNLLEMVAEVLVMSLGRVGAADRAPLGRAGGPVLPMLAPGVRAHERLSDDGGTGIDRLAGVENHRSFELGLEDMATAPVSGLRMRYVLFVDIDRFRLIREYGGEMTAERMIRVFSELLRREMAGEKLIGRLGMDKFGVVIERRSREQAVQLAEALVGVVDSLRLSFFGQRFDVSISIGIAELHNGTGSGLACLRRAMQACQAAQKQGGGTVLTYHDNLAIPRRSRSEGRLLNRLTRALKDDALEIYAQLIAPLDESANPPASPPFMHELLLRMRDEEGGLIGAGAFLTVAERYGLSVKLDRWVIKRAFRQIAATPYAHDPDYRFTLNLSGHSIDDHNLLDFIVEEFDQSGLPPQRICFEITETAAISDIGAAQKFVEDLKKLGCEFALDDFGSGHSSFLYLRDLPIDYLKIDGELVREIANDPVSLAFVRTIEGVARLMGRRTVAECVENDAIRDAIAEIGCTYAQGYLMGSPVPLADVLKGPDA